MTILETLTLGRKHDISPAAMHALLAVLSDPPMNPSHIATITGMSAAAITGSIDRLEQVGMVHRIAYRGDRRSRPVTPTELAFSLFQSCVEDS